MIAEQCWNDSDKEKTEEVGEKPVAVPLCPPHALPCDQIRD